MSETKREWDTMNIATLPYVYIVEIKTQGKYKSYYSHEQINQRIPQFKGCAFRLYKYSNAHNRLTNQPTEYTENKIIRS